MTTPRCPGHVRHWFAYYGMPGSSSPRCVRCHAPNRHYDIDRDPYHKPCPRSRCTGTLAVVEEGTLNGVHVTYSDCDTCRRSVREEHTSHDEPTLLEQQP